MRQHLYAEQRLKRFRVQGRGDLESAAIGEHPIGNQHVTMRVKPEKIAEGLNGVDGGRPRAGARFAPRCILFLNSPPGAAAQLGQQLPIV